VSATPWQAHDGSRSTGLPPLTKLDGLTLGYGQLDDHYRLRPKDFTVITGIPSHGKSSFITDVACRMAHRHNWVTCFASFEQTPQMDHRRALRTWFHGKWEKEQSPTEIDQADRWINRMFCFIVPSDDDYPTLGWVMDRASAAVVRYGARMVVIDPWNELDHTRPSGESLTEYTGFAIKEFKRFARKHDIHLIVAAHPTKMLPEKDGSIRIPSLYDISDSAHWANKADVGLVIWRGVDKFGNQISKVKIAKVRYQDEIGLPGEVAVHFNVHTARFECIE
jgi:twinkle protein